MKTIGTNQFKNDLVDKFVSKNKEESKGQIVQHLYRQYKKELSTPKLTTQNLIKAIRYINKYNLTEADYNKAIKKTASTSSALTQSQFAKIYDYIIQHRNVQATLNRHNVLRVYNWIFATIVNTVNQGGKVRLSHVGSFVGMLRKARKYKIPSTGKMKKVDQHLVPKFRPSAVWKRQLRK